MRVSGWLRRRRRRARLGGFGFWGRRQPRISELYFAPDLLDRWAELSGVDRSEGVDRERVERLRDAIDDLEPELREVINGVFYEGVHKTEVARRLGVSRYHVDMFLARALEALHDAAV